MYINKFVKQTIDGGKIKKMFIRSTQRIDAPTDII